MTFWMVKFLSKHKGNVFWLISPETPKMNQKHQRFLPTTLYLIQKAPYPTYPALYFPPPTREHIFFTLPIILLNRVTKKRLNRVTKKRLNIETDDNCSHCKQESEDIQHIFFFPVSQPAVKWMRREISGIAPEAAFNNHWFFLFATKITILVKRKLQFPPMAHYFLSIHSRSWCRYTDLWVMGPGFRCTNLLIVSWVCEQINNVKEVRGMIEVK